MTIEDETGCANLVIFPNINPIYRKALLESRLFMAEGTVQIEGDVIHVIVNSGYNISKLFRRLTVGNEDLLIDNLPSAVETTTRPTDESDIGEKKLFPDARNFR